MKKQTTIKAKIMTILIALSLAFFLIFESVSLVSMMKMRNEIRQRNNLLGNSASEQSSETLLSKTSEQLMTTTNGITEYSNEMFAKVESQILVIAKFLESIYNDDSGIYVDDKLSPYGILTQEDYEANLNESPRSPLLHIKAEANAWSNGSLTESAQKDLNLISPIAPLLVESTKTNDIITACYIGSVEGFQFSADSLTSQNSVGATNFGGEGGVKGRDWFMVAKDLEKGDTAWTSIFLDNSGRGASLTCATPVFDKTGKLRAVVAGSGIVKEYGEVVTNVAIGNSGKSFIVDKTGNIIITKDEIDFENGKPKYKNLKDNAGETIISTIPKITGSESGYVIGDYNGKKVLMAYSPISSQSWSFIVIIEMEEVLIPSNELSNKILNETKISIASLDRYINNSIWIIAVIMAISLAIVIYLAKRFSSSLSAPILKLTNAVIKIDGGNLDETIEINSNDETHILADSFNKMTLNLKNYISNLATITAEKERIGAELSVATHIQASMLPCIFPAFPERSEFEIFANMQPAKEVGGDFYDFFLVDNDHLAVVIADVSGKGVPAALFMVIAKTLIKNHAQMGKSVSEILTETNAQLCENNDAGLFVTAWIGILEISTGKFTYGNAGHNAPLIKRKNGKFEFIKQRAGFVLAGLEDFVYKTFETSLHKGDVLFLYTDGVTEATNSKNELFGDPLLLETLNKMNSTEPKMILDTITQEIANFVKGEQQFDDITMLALLINVENDMKYLEIDAVLQNLDKVQAFIETELENADASPKACIQITVAIEEIFINICKHAYKEVGGYLKVGCKIIDNILTMQFFDNGDMFDPNTIIPDTTSSIEDRKIGGLGILMVKKSMNSMTYSYENKQNVLTLEKSL